MCGWADGLRSRVRLSSQPGLCGGDGSRLQRPWGGGLAVGWLSHCRRPSEDRPDAVVRYLAGVRPDVMCNG